MVALLYGFRGDLLVLPARTQPTVETLAKADVGNPRAVDPIGLGSSNRTGAGPQVNESAVSGSIVTDDATDALFDSVAIADLCDDPASGKSLETKTLIRHYISDPRHSRGVVRTTEQSIKRLCGGDRPAVTLAEGGERDPLKYLTAHSTSFQETLAFVEMQKDGKLTGDARDQLNEFVLRKIRDAQGLHELIETLVALGQTRSVASALGVYGYPSNLDDDSAGYAAIIASCEIFGGCKAESPFAIRLCFLVCEQPMSASEFALNSVPAMRQRDLERAAAAIVAARRGQ